MEPIQINISVPFRLDGTQKDHPGCIRKFSSLEINAWLKAVTQEIVSAQEDAGEYQVQEIAFTTGSVTHLGTEIPKQLLTLLRRTFPVIEDVRITLRATPSALEFFMINAIRQLGNSFLLIELPTLESEGLSEAGYVCTRQQALDALDSCFQNGFRRFGCELDPRYFRTPEGAEESLREILARKPQLISFASAPDAAYAQCLEPLLEVEGYHRGRESDAWFLGEEPSRRVFRNQIGFGPYAVSVFDAQAVRSTADFEFYLSHADDFEALVRHDMA